MWNISLLEYAIHIVVTHTVVLYFQILVTTSFLPLKLKVLDRGYTHTHLCSTHEPAPTGHRAPGPYLPGGSATFRRDEALPAELLGGLRADERRVHVVDQLGVGEEALILGALGLGLGLGLALGWLA